MAENVWLVRQHGAEPHSGLLAWAGQSFPASLGRSGIRTDKREGDGATPVGSFRFRRLYWRADRLERPKTGGLPSFSIRPQDGWCDAAADPRYNRPVCLPYPASAECLWRVDGLYDLILVIGHNDSPVVPGAGSAVFVHLRRPDLGPTAGCVALERPDFLRLLENAGPESRIEIQAG